MLNLMPVKQNPSVGMRTKRQNFYIAVPTSTLISLFLKKTEHGIPLVQIV
jgi:hypothetical protein